MFEKGSGYSQGKPETGGQNEPVWERSVLNKLVMSAVQEQRRSRRWGIFFKLMFLTYLLALLYVYLPGEGVSKGMVIGKHTALVELEGLIAQETHASADTVITGLRAAFKDRNTKGVIIRANSPGGSPVQAGYVYDEIKRLREKYPEIPLYAVITDMCASACYYIVAAADKIYADKASIVGSIGVLYDGFGFTSLMDKVGVERRLITAGDNKGMLDPFSPVSNKDVIHLKTLLDGIHQQFIQIVKEGRGDRLSDDAEIFSGLFWLGDESEKMGLIDGLASSSQIARDTIGEESIVDFTPKEDIFDRFTDNLGASIGRGMMPANGLVSPLR
jgi:protease-4